MTEEQTRKDIEWLNETNWPYSVDAVRLGRIADALERGLRMEQWVADLQAGCHDEEFRERVEALEEQHAAVEEELLGSLKVKDQRISELEARVRTSVRSATAYLEEEYRLNRGRIRELEAEVERLTKLLNMYGLTPPTFLFREEPINE